MDCFESLDKAAPGCVQEGMALELRLKSFQMFVKGMLPFCYYPYIHSSQKRFGNNSVSPGRSIGINCKFRVPIVSNNLISVADIKQEPGSPEDGQMVGGGWTEGPSKGDCLYDVRASQTRSKQDNRTQTR